MERSKVVDIYLKYFESIRNEAIQRIILRDTTLVVYITTMGTYLAYVSQRHFERPLHEIDLPTALIQITPLSVICLVFSLVILQHHFMINRIGRFLAEELKLPSDLAVDFPHWDTSVALSGRRGIDFGFRLWAQLLVLTLPLIYVVAFVSWFHEACLARGAPWPQLLYVLASVDAAVFLIILYLHVAVHKRMQEPIDLGPRTPNP